MSENVDDSEDVSAESQEIQDILGANDMTSEDNMEFFAGFQVIL